MPPKSIDVSKIDRSGPLSRREKKMIKMFDDARKIVAGSGHAFCDCDLCEFLSQSRRQQNEQSLARGIIPTSIVKTLEQRTKRTSH